MAGDNTNKVTLLFNDSNPNKNGFIAENPASPNTTDTQRTEIRNYGGSTEGPGGIGRADKKTLALMFNDSVNSFFSIGGDINIVSRFFSGRDDLSGRGLPDDISSAISAIEEYLERQDISGPERTQAAQDLQALRNIDEQNFDITNEEISIISQQIGGDISYNPDFEQGSVNFAYLNSDSRSQDDVSFKSHNIDTNGENVFPTKRESGFGSTEDISAGGRHIYAKLLNRYRQ
jgi:hypothetical protein